MTTMARRLMLPILREVPKRLYVSRNDKTGFSLNVPIDRTCRPTEACGRYCYGKGGPIAWDRSIARQEENHERLEALRDAPMQEVEMEADLVYHHVWPQDFFRLYGVGDLTEGGVRFINALARRHPDLVLWVSTRKIDLARKLLYVKNLHVMCSLDATTKGADLHATWDYVQARKGQAFAAWAQQSSDEAIPDWVEVVFPEHVRGKRAPWTKDEATRDARSCPATVVGGAAHRDACADCRFCFSTEKRADRS